MSQSREFGLYKPQSFFSRPISFAMVSALHPTATRPFFSLQMMFEAFGFSPIGRCRNLLRYLLVSPSALADREACHF
jgi:hypothetical protein